MKTYGVRQHGKETMSRRQCDSDNQCEFGGEMGIHYSDLKELGRKQTRAMPLRVSVSTRFQG
jgi:hypothetical protein